MLILYTYTLYVRPFYLCRFSAKGENDANLDNGVIDASLTPISYLYPDSFSVYT